MKLTMEYVQTPQQIAAIAALAEDIWLSHYQQMISVEQIHYMLEKFQSIPAMTEQIEAQGYEYYEMLLEGERIGYLSIKQEENRLFLSKFYIHQQYRGHGYASKAMAWLTGLCQERGLHAIWLTVNRHNRTAIAVYEQKGFRKLRTQVADIGGGFVMDDYIMELAVPAGS